MEVEERVGIGADEPLGQRGGLGEERPVPVAEGHRGVGARPHLPGGHDVERGRRGDALGMVERHPVGHTAAAVVPDDREGVVPERGHRLRQVERERPLRVGGVVGRRCRPEGGPVAGEIRDDDGVPLAQERRGGVPHEVGLRIAVQQQDRRTAPADPGEDGAPPRRHRALGEVLEHGPSFLLGRGQAVPRAARRNAVAWATDARVARVSVSELSSMKSCTVPS